MDKRHLELIQTGDKLFSDRRALELLWQEIAEQFYVERADFTTKRVMGEDFASNLDTSYPLIVRRDLGNAFGAMLRPPGKEWFHVGVKRDENLDEAGRQWLEMAGRVQTRAIYDRESGFVRATKEGDHDYAAFGQTVLTSEPAITPTSGFIVLHRAWHLRDVAWAENSFGEIDHIQRKWKATARDLKKRFRNVHREVSKAAEKEPFRQFNIRHIVVSSADYEKSFRQPWVSIYIDVENEHVMEEVGSWWKIYVIPRWETVSGSQYAYSPATVAALPDSRLIQAMTYTLLTAGEFAVEPPMIGVEEAIKGAIEAFPGGFTAVDAQYDERLGEVLRPLYKGGEKAIPLGVEMNEMTKSGIAEAFYLSKLALPPAGMGGMSPFEVSQRIDEFVRQNLPLFEPMEQDYNGQLMEQDFDILFRAGAFGRVEDIPESLGGRETEFRFESPLRESIDRVRGQQFLEGKALIAEAAQLDPSVVPMMNVREALRDSLHGLRVPADWLEEDEVLDQFAEAQAQAAQVQGGMDMASQGAEIVKQVGEAAGAVSE